MTRNTVPVRSRILVVGEALVDLVAEPGGDGRRFIAHPGGGPANTAVALARLETAVSMAVRLSGDAFGRILRAHLDNAGVDLSCAVAADELSSLAVASLDQSGAADYSFHVTDTADWQWRAGELPDPLPADVAAVHTGSLALTLAPGSRVIEAFLAIARASAAVCIDPNTRVRLVGDVSLYRDRFAEWLGRCDIVKVSADDLAVLTPGREPAEAARLFAATGPRLAVVTLGGDGALAAIGDEVVSVPGIPVDVVDTVGAGDAFTGGLLDSLLRASRLAPGLPGLTAADVVQALDYAVRVAAVTCSRAGADPPRRDEVPAPVS